MLAVSALWVAGCGESAPCAGSSCTAPDEADDSLPSDEAKLLDLIASPTGSINDRSGVEWAVRTGHYAGNVTYGVAPVPANLKQWKFQLGDLACLNLEERNRFSAHEEDLKNAIAAGTPFEAAFDQERAVAECRPNLPGSYELSWSLEFDGRSYTEEASYRSLDLALSNGTALELSVRFVAEATVIDSASGAASSHSVMRSFGDCGRGDSINPSPYDAAGIVDVTADGKYMVRKVVAVPSASGAASYVLEQSADEASQFPITFRIRGDDGTLSCRRNQTSETNEVECAGSDGQPSYAWPWSGPRPDVRAVDEICFRLPAGGQ